MGTVNNPEVIASLSTISDCSEYHFVSKLRTVGMHLVCLLTQYGERVHSWLRTAA